MLWKKLLRLRAMIPESSREAGLVIGLFCCLIALYLVDKTSKLGMATVVLGLLYSAYQLSRFYVHRNKE